MNSSQVPRPIPGHYYLLTDTLEACYELRGEKSGLITPLRARGIPNERICDLTLEFFSRTKLIKKKKESFKRKVLRGDFYAIIYLCKMCISATSNAFSYATLMINKIKKKSSTYLIIIIFSIYSSSSTLFQATKSLDFVCLDLPILYFHINILILYLYFYGCLLYFCCCCCFEDLFVWLKMGNRDHANLRVAVHTSVRGEWVSCLVTAATLHAVFTVFSVSFLTPGQK